MLNKSKNRVLVLAPHTDDGELGCGGTISKLIESGDEVFYVVFSTCSRSLPAGLAPDTLAKEVLNATEILGIPNENVILFDYDVRTFGTYRQEILEDLIKLRNSIKPTMVFLPSPTDIHQDHEVITKEGVRAFKNVNVFGYEMPWNNFSFNTRSFTKLSNDHMNLKIKALQAYKSQSHRPYFNEKFIRSLAYTRGVQIGSEFAEAFEVIRMVWE
jgi:LmbE family N-acetylglucosaminyl deacetylase